jgi:hypothetical protein
MRASIVAGSIGAAALLAASATPADAYWPDDRSHPVRTIDSFYSYYAIANQGAASALSNIRTNTVWLGSELYLTSSGASVRDVNQYTDSSVPGYGASTQCIVVNGSGNCDMWTVIYFPNAFSSTQRASQNFWTALACEEITHTLGIGERTQWDCLNSNYWQSNYNNSTARSPWANALDVNYVHNHV